MGSVPHEPRLSLAAWSLVATLALALVAIARAQIPSAPAASGGDWPCFRGPTHDGISPEPFAFPAAGPRLAWKVNVGPGHSAVAIAAGRAYTLGNLEGQDIVWCLDAATGKELWRHTYPCNARFAITKHDGPAATPAVDGPTVFVFSRMGHALALDAATGKRQWMRDLRKEEGATPPTWGFCGSPRVHGKLLLLNFGPAGIALDKANGKTLWKSEGAQVAGYATPVVFTQDGADRAAIFTGGALVVVDPATGTPVWQTPWPQPIKLNAVDPVIWGDRVFISGGRKVGGAVHRIGQAAEVWRNQNLNTSWHTAILWQDHLYGCEGGSPEGAGRSPNSLRCLDARTGDLKWQDPRPAFCGLILVGGKLLVLTELGELIAVEASPAAYRELGKAQVLDAKTFTAPAFAGGKVYVRNLKGDVACWDMK